MIRNIIFDLGNVLLYFKPDEFLLQYTQDKDYIQEFISKVIRSEIWLKLDRGTISLKKAENEFLRQFPEDHNLIRIFFEHWTEMLTPINDNVKILQDLKSNGYNIYILSNFIKEAFDIMRNKYKFLSLFDGKIISSYEQVIKPELEIYQRLIIKYGLIPEECIFIDDIPPFLSHARKLGMKTILFLPKTDLRLELCKFGVNV